MSAFSMARFVNQRGFIETLEDVTPFASTMKDRTLLQDVFFRKLDDGKTAIVATDSYRLIHRVVDWEMDRSFRIPASYLKKAKTFFGKGKIGDVLQLQVAKNNPLAFRILNKEFSGVEITRNPTNEWVKYDTFQPQSKYTTLSLPKEVTIPKFHKTKNFVGMVTFGDGKFDVKIRKQGQAPDPGQFLINLNYLAGCLKGATTIRVDTKDQAGKPAWFHQPNDSYALVMTLAY